ncbi:MAG: class I SAM-dependent methyltransferase [Pleurocapsa minor HA4230-MV1]|jgi:SAM-dependent methyltransferase|nr:class I SAM-dependent methyltransferase [Pleurocapsa minor HA4230-MV1]
MKQIIGRIKTKIEQYLLKNSSRVYLYNCNQEFASKLKPNSLVLDAGAGNAPYQELFANFNYETADKFDSSCKYVCDLVAIPVQDERFDYIVCNQVLEHLPEPKQALKELCRVLKTGGEIICTTPFFYEEHLQPNDFYRYTQFGHAYLFKEAGFEVEKIEWLEGYFGTLAYQLEVAYRSLPSALTSIVKNWFGLVLSPFLILCKVLFLLLSAIFYRLDLKVKFTSNGHPKNYVIIAKKV